MTLSCRKIILMAFGIFLFGVSLTQAEPLEELSCGELEKKAAQIQELIERNCSQQGASIADTFPPPAAGQELPIDNVTSPSVASGQGAQTPPIKNSGRPLGQWDTGAREARCGNYLLRTSKSLFAPNEEIVFEFTGLPTTAYVINVSESSKPTTSFLAYLSPNGRAQGTDRFPGLPPGSYQIRLFVEPYEPTVDCALDVKVGETYLFKGSEPRPVEP